MQNRFKVLVALLGLFPWCGITANAADVDLQPGAKAPAFTLPSQDGTPVSLSDYRGKWVVLYFYPKDKSTGCTIQAHEYQSDLSKFEAHHAVVLGVSLDTAESHKSFCTQDGLTFKLLADPDRQAATAYGVPLMTFKDMRVRRAGYFSNLAQGNDRTGVEKGGSAKGQFYCSGSDCQPG